MRRRDLLLAAPGLAVLGRAGRLLASDYGAAEKAAKGQTVYFNAWGGAQEINDYITWAGDELGKRFGVGLVHVKLTDTSEAVARVVAEKAAGRESGGSVDLIWINGENFRAMRQQALLYGPFAADLPNFRYVDTKGKPTTLVDFTIPTEGYESPWGMAQFVLFYDSARVPDPPRTLDAIRAFAEAHPGRFTYPAPPNFTGATFVKQVIYGTIQDRKRLEQPVDEAAFRELAAPAFAWLEAIRPHLWRGGATYPATGPAQHQLLDDGEVDLSMAFNPSEASTLINQGRLPKTVRSFILDGGTIANSHFLAIPFDAAHKEGAMVAANFLLSPEAQARKQDPQVWGDPTVLDVAALPPAEKALFDRLDLGVATLTPEQLKPQLPEPHPSWTDMVKKVWPERFAR
jgi:putative thiamine transport system substrate-binding protein